MAKNNYLKLYKLSQNLRCNPFSNLKKNIAATHNIMELTLDSWKEALNTYIF